MLDTIKRAVGRLLVRLILPALPVVEVRSIKGLDPATGKLQLGPVAPRRPARAASSKGRRKGRA